MPPTHEEPPNQAALSISNPSQLMLFHFTALTWVWDPGASLPGEQPNQQTSDSPWLFVWALNYCLPGGRAPEPSRSLCPQIPSSPEARPLSSWLGNICSNQLSSWFSCLLTKYPTHLLGECYGSMLPFIVPLGSLPISKKFYICQCIKQMD